MDRPVEPRTNPDWLGRITGRVGSSTSGLAEDDESDRQHVRIFVLSHITGPFIGTEQFPVPLQPPPDQPMNREVELAVARSVTSVPAA